MSRWIVSLVALSFAVTSVGADPKPLWEIDTFPDAKGWHPVWWLGYTPDGKTLAAQVVEKYDFGASDCRLFAWDVATRKESLNHKLGQCEHIGGGMRANAVTKAGSVLVTGRAPEEIRLTDGASTAVKELPRPIGAWLNPETSHSLWLQVFDPLVGEHRLAYGRMPPLAPDPKGGANRELWLKTKLPGDWMDGGRLNVAVNFDLTRLAYTRSDGKLALHNITVAGELKLIEVATVPRAHVGRISTLRFSPDGKALATGSADSTVCLWDVEKADKDWKPRVTIAAGKFTVGALAFSPDGRTLAVGTWDHKGRSNLFVIDVAGGKLLGSYALPRELMSAAYSPDSKVLVTGNTLGLIQAWDAEALRNP